MAGRGEEIKGSLKEGAGKILHNEDMEASGRVEKNRGRVKRRAGGSAKELAGTAKMGAGKLTGNKSLQAKGKAEREAGLLDES